MKMNSIKALPNLPKGKELIMKKILKIVANVLLLILGLVFIGSIFSELAVFNNSKIKFSLLIFYLISKLILYKIDSKDVQKEN